MPASVKTARLSVSAGSVSRGLLRAAAIRLDKVLRVLHLWKVCNWGWLNLDEVSISPTEEATAAELMSLFA